MAKDKRYFCLIEIGFIVKKENELHLFYSIYSIFYLIPKIYFKNYRLGVVVQINFFFIFLKSFLLLLLLFNLMIVINVILLLPLSFIIVMLFLCLLYF